MYRQATLGDIDFITGDYLAGMFLFSFGVNYMLIGLRGQHGKQRASF
jgi:hypothetical protein